MAIRRLLVSVSFVLVLGLVSFGSDDGSTGPVADAGAWTFEKVSGDFQTISAYDTLDHRLVVQLKDGLKKNLRNYQIRFFLVSGNGEVFARPAGPVAPQEVNVPTDWQGRAAASFRNFGGGTSTVRAQVTERPELAVTFTIYTQ